MGQYADEYLKARLAGASGDQARSQAYYSTHDSGTPMAPKENPYSILQLGVQNGDIVERNGRYFLNEDSPNAAAASAAARASANMDPKSAYEKYVERYNQVLASTPGTTAARKAQETYNRAYETAKAKNASGSTLAKKIGQAAFGTAELIRHWDEIAGNKAKNQSEEEKKAASEAVARKYEEKKAQGASNMEALLSAIREASNEATQEKSPEYLRAMEQIRADAAKAIPKINEASKTAAKIENVAEGWAQGRIGADLTAIGSTLYKGIGKLAGATDEQIGSVTGAIKDIGNAKQMQGQAMQNSVTDNMGKLGRFGVNVATTMADVYADSLINLATGGFGGLTALGIRSFGNGVSEAMNEGKSEEQQMLTGLKSAVIEVGTELIGGPFEGAYGRSLLSTATNKAVTRLASTPAGRAGLKILYNGLEEGFEEALSGILNPLADRLLGLSDTTDFDVSEIIYETLLGAATGAIGGAGQIVRGSGVYKGNAQEIVDFAREKGNERLANELQAKLDSKGQLTVGDVQDLMASAGTGKKYEQKVREFQQEQQQKAEQQTARMLEAAKKEQSAERARQDFRSRENFTDEEMGMAVENKAVEFRTSDGRTAQIGDFKISDDGTLQAEMELSDGETITRDADDLTEHLPEAYKLLINNARGNFGKQAALVIDEYEAGQNVADYIMASERALNMLASYGATAEDMKKDPVISGVLTDGQIAKFATVGAVIGQQRQAKMQKRAAELENISKIAEAIESAGPEQGVAEETAGWEQAVSDVRSYMNDIRTEITSLTAAMGSMEEGTEEYTAAEARLGQMKGYLADATEQYHSFTEKLAELKGRTFERRKRGTISFEGDPENGLDGVDIGKMSTKQKQALAAIEAITDAAAIDVVIYDAPMVDAKTREATGANRGKFDPNTGKIYLNINDTADNGRVLVMSTFSHELTHFIQKFSPDAYEELKEFVIRQYFNGNTEIFANRVSKMMQENANTGMTADQAADEIVADSCSEMLLDSEAVKTLAREHYTLAEKIAEFIQKLCSKIRAAFTDRFEGKQFPATARWILQDVETMQKIWDKGLIQAEHNRAAQEMVNRKMAAEEKENAAGDGDVQFMKYETRDDGIEVYETSPEVKNLSWKEKKNRFRQFMENEYRGRTAKFVRNGHAYYARFEYRDIRKNIYGDNDSDRAGKDAKINAGADGDIFDLVENSEYIGSLAERNIADNAHGATKSWDYYIKTVQIDDRVFDLLANVRRPESGEYVYNIELYENNKIKAVSPSSQAFTATSVRGPTASADTIAQQEQEGKEKILEQRYEAWDEDHPALVAVHNKSVNGVRRMLERNGVPFPSIAIKKAGTKHVGFGDVSIVFPRSTIDPAANRENRLYSNDAWTPTEPRTEYDIGSTKEYREKLKGIIGADVYSALRANSRMEETGMTNAIESANGNVFEAVKKFPELKYAWKKSIGEEPASGFTEEDLDGFHRHTNDELVSVFKEVDGGKIEHLTYDDKETLGKIADVLNKHFLNGIDNKIKRDYFAKNLPYTAEDINPYIIRDAYTKYRDNNYGIGKVLDGRALESALRADKETETDPAYREWVENFFEGIIKDSGIPNGKSIYTDSGNRRSFKARHVDATLENIVKEMRKQKETGNGVFDVNLRGAATKAYNSVEEMRAESGRLLGEHVSDDVFDSYMNEFGERLYDLAFSAVKHKRDTNDFSYGDAEKNILLDAIRDGKTKSGMRKILLQNSQWIDYSEELADGLWQLKQDVQNMPAPYFEAKPRRIVTPDEALAYIMPDNADRDVIDELERRGLNVLTYRADDEEDRLEKLNSITDAQFQRFEDSDGNELSPEQAVYFRDSKVRDADGRLLKLYHGTQAWGFTVFDNKYSDDKLSFFMTDSKGVAQTYSGVLSEDSPINGREKTLEELSRELNGSVYARGKVIQTPEVRRRIGMYEDRLNDNAELAERFLTDGTFRRVAEAAREITKEYFGDFNDGAYIEGIEETIRNAEKELRVYATIDFEHPEEAYAAFEAAGTEKGTYGHSSLEKLYDRARDAITGKELVQLREFRNFTGWTATDMELLDFLAAANRSGGKQILQVEDTLFAKGGDAGTRFYASAEEVPEELSQRNKGNYPLYANLTNPMIIEANGSQWDDLPWGSEDEYTTRDAAQEARRRGFDGVIIRNVYDEGPNGMGYSPSTVVIAFKSNQVKDAYNRNPTEDPDIRYQRFEDPNQMSLFDDAQDFFRQMDLFEETGEMPAAQTADGFDEELQERVRSGKLHPDVAKDLKWRRDTARELKKFFDGSRFVSDEDIDDMLGTSAWADEDRNRLLEEIWDEYKNRGADRMETWKLTEKILNDPNTEQGDKFAYTDEDFNRWYWRRNYKTQQFTGEEAKKYLGWNGNIGLKTYTDDGEVEYARANIYVPEAEDVQYQQYEAGDTEEQELIDRQKALNTIRAESAALRDAQQAIAKILQETGNRLKVSEEKQVKEADARKMAKRLIRQWSSTADIESVTRELRTIGNMAVQGADFESIKAKARDVASYIVSTSEEEDEGYDPTAYNAVRDILKGGVRVDDAHKPTDFNEWRKANFGRITIKNNGMTVDEAYAAAREALGNGMDGILPEDIAQGDMLDTLMNALEILGPTKSNRYARHIGEFAESLANDIVADAVENSAMQLDETLADRFGGKRLERAAGPVRRELEEAAALAAERTEGAESALQAAERTITQAESETRRRVAEARADERRTAAEAAAQEAEAAGEEKKAAVEKAREQERKKAQKKLDSAKKRLSTLRDEKNARIAQIREEAKAEKAEAVAREKAAKWQKVKEVSDYYRNQAKNAAEKRKESAGAAKYRKRIQTRALKLMDWLEKNSQKEHVPEALKGPLANFLQSISFESKRSLGGGDRTQNDERMASRMGKLAEILEQQNRYQNGAENVLGITERYIDLPEGIVERLKDIQQTATRMMEQGDSYTINEMTAEELKDLDEILKAISHAVTEMNNLAYNGRYHSVIDLAEDSISELEDKPEIRSSLVRQGDKGNFAATVNDFLSFDNAVPYYAFKRYGDAAFSVFEGIVKGWGQMARNARTVINFTEQAYTPDQAKAWGKETHEFTLSGGDRITMTAAEMMSFYELSKREQALKHIFGGGIRTGKSTEHHVMSLSDIAMINAALTEQQKKVADTLQGFLGGTCSEWGNEISMARFGIRQFGEENYFPIETDDTDRNAIDPQAKKNDMYRLLNVGFTKSLNVHANNTLIVSDIFDVFANHTSDMAKLNGIGLPMLDAIKWFNYREKETLPTGQIRTRSMQRAIERAYGKGGTGYFTQFMKDLNGVREGGRGEGFLKAIISNYKVAQIGANLRVVIQQPTSIARAGMEIAPKYLAKGVFTKGGYEEMMENSGIAVWKIDLGFYDVNINRGMREKIKNTATWKENLQDKATELAGKADEITWTAMWNACRAEQKDLHPDYSQAELMQATTERFENLMLATQVMDSTISRSQIMRGGELGLAEYTGFMSEPTMSWNMLSQNFLQFRDDWRKNGYAAAWKKHGGRLAKAVTVFAASAALTSAVAAIADAARDDDEYANWLQKWMSHFGDNFYDNAKPWGLVPIVSQLAEVIEYKVFDIGYSPDGSMLTDGINTLIDAAKLMFEDRKKYTDWGIAYKTMQAASMLSGIPAAALGREIVAVINSGIQTYNEMMGEKTGEKVPLIKTYRPDPKYAIKDAYEAGYISDEEAQQALVDEGAAKDETAAGKTVYGWTNQTPAGGTVYDNLYTAVREGNSAEVNRILSDMYAHGYSEDTVQNKLKTEIRGWYVNPLTQFSKQDAVNALMTYCGMDTVIANQKCSYWFFMNEHPEANTDGKGENPKQGELAPALIRAEQSGELSHADAQTIWAGCNNWKTTYDEYLNGVRR